MDGWMRRKQDKEKRRNKGSEWLVGWVDEERGKNRIVREEKKPQPSPPPKNTKIRQIHPKTLLIDSARKILAKKKNFAKNLQHESSDPHPHPHPHPEPDPGK